MQIRVTWLFLCGNYSANNASMKISRSNDVCANTALNRIDRRCIISLYHFQMNLWSRLHIWVWRRSIIHATQRPCYNMMNSAKSGLLSNPATPTQQQQQQQHQHTVCSDSVNTNNNNCAMPNNNSNNNSHVQIKQCAGCGGKIIDRFLLHAMDRYWHTGCLKCSCCQAQLGELGTSCFTKSGMILCKRDYIR